MTLREWLAEPGLRTCRFADRHGIATEVTRGRGGQAFTVRQPDRVASATRLLFRLHYAVELDRAVDARQGVEA